MASQFFLLLPCLETMDEYEKLAFELEVLLRRAQKTFPRDEFFEAVLKDSMDQFRFQSRTWRKPISSYTPLLKD